MKSTRIILIVAIVAVAAFVTVVVYASLTQGPPPTELAKFTGGTPVSSDVTVTDVFQVNTEAWTVDLSSGTQFPGWSLEVELYEEGEDTTPLRSLRGRWAVLGDSLAWERGPGTTEGAFPAPHDYRPDLPPGSYYLKIFWTRISWTIIIFEEP